MIGVELERLRRQEVWIAWIRLFAVPWAVFEVGFNTHDYPPGHLAAAWATTAVLAAGAAAFMWLSRLELPPRGYSRVGLAALLLDTGVIYSYFFVYTFEPGLPTRPLLFLVVIEAALRYGVRGGVALPLATLPALAAAEWWRAERFAPPPFDLRYVTMPLGVELITGLIVGGLVKQLRREATVAESRAVEAEELRDRLARRADELEAVNRCARALSSSLDQEEAFRLFLGEARTAFAFERLELVVSEGERAEVLARGGRAEDAVFPRGTGPPVEDSIVADVLAGRQTITREDMEAEPRYPEERELVEMALRSRVVAPLSVGARTLGILSVAREPPNAFSADEVEMVTLLAGQVATAVENIRVFEAERHAAEELRRLSALRADFVSLVSHELRAPMASVIGCAATLRKRWRTLSAEQRESFLALIEEETARLAGLVGDVLDTSRLDAGTFTYAFGNVDVAELVRETAAAADISQEEVSIRADVDRPLPAVRGDRNRLRQLLLNLVMNAVKYTDPGDEVEVRADAEDGVVAVSVRDHGPGIAPEDQRLIFEKFGRAKPLGNSKPGAGLGLFIARSIAEAHGGSLEVESEPGAGARFTVRLPTPSR
ncbi:MAG: ATP-binding protein [Actinomycetota bacterium]|nr:ATP-binding protein [Actinomycetota bacterium]